MYTKQKNTSEIIKIELIIVSLAPASIYIFLEKKKIKILHKNWP